MPTANMERTNTRLAQGREWHDYVFVSLSNKKQKKGKIQRRQLLFNIGRRRRRRRRLVCSLEQCCLGATTGPPVFQVAADQLWGTGRSRR